METRMIHGYRCQLLEASGPWLIWLAGSGEDGEKLAQEIRKLTEKPFSLAVLEAENWNRDYSPWPAEAVFGRDDFPGGGEKTLEALRTLMAELTGKKLLGGYSLAGLFALWAAFQVKDLSGAASCSGSLWYPGWLAWQAERSMPEDCAVYLSLGKKEEVTRNRQMAQVGDATRAQHETFVGQLGEDNTTLVWHPGGHFHEPLARMAQGFVWMMEKRK